MSASTSLPSLLATLALVTACSSATPTVTPPSSTSEPGAAAAPETPPGGGDAPSATPSAAASPAKAKKAESVQDCKDLAATPSDEGDSSAAPLPTGDAKSDRLAPMRDFIKSRRPGFRCCFDIWAGRIPEARLYTKVNFELQLDPAGKLKKATATPEKDGPLVSKEVETCLIDVAGTLTYPKSASGMDTTYTHRFDFKPRR